MINAKPDNGGLQLFEVQLHGGPDDGRRVLVHSQQTVIHLPTGDDDMIAVYDRRTKSGLWEYLGVFARE